MPLTKFSIDVRGHEAACWQGGRGTPLVLLHGSGPGAASTGTWRHVVEPLMAQHHVHTTDLIGFGESQRKTEGDFFDPDLWLAQVRALLDHIGQPEVHVVGHSISGALALRLAAHDRRIIRLVTTATMGADFACNPETERCWTFPETREQLRATLQSLMYDRSGITEELLDYRMGILHSGGYGAYFGRMFAGDKQRFISETTVAGSTLNKIACPVLMIHGRDDIMFPAEGTTLEIAKHLPQADILLLSRCRHLPAFEQPAKVVEAVSAFLARA